MGWMEATRPGNARQVELDPFSSRPTLLIPSTDERLEMRSKHFLKTIRKLHYSILQATVL